MSNCTCGSKTVNGPGHSNWCDINGLHLETGWDEFNTLMNVLGTGGIYVYITYDWQKLIATTHWGKGIFRVLTPDQYNSGVKYIDITRIYIDINCTDPSIMDTLNRDITPGGVVQICYD